jgi:hypothetical protein
METSDQVIAAALVATAVIYGTDVFAAIVLRPALAVQWCPWGGRR